MKELKTLQELKNHFASVKETVNVRMVFKTAYRTLPDGITKVRIPYPVLIPAENTTAIADYFTDVDKLGYESKKIFRMGVKLYFSAKFVPVFIDETKAKKAKTMPIDYMVEFMATADKEYVLANLANIKQLAEEAWQAEPIENKTVEFCFVNDVLAKELDNFTDAILK